jgi:hypothetical protein
MFHYVSFSTNLSTDKSVINIVMVSYVGIIYGYDNGLLFMGTIERNLSISIVVFWVVTLKDGGVAF